MHRLIAFGCSHTFGHSLPDCICFDSDGTTVDPLPPPSQFAWPKLLANMLGRECINQGWNGYSNQAILDEILRFNFWPTDIVCVLWTYRIRAMEYTKDANFHQGSWNEKWTREVNVYDAEMKSMIAKHHAYCYLTTRNLNFYMMDLSVQRDARLDNVAPYLNVPLIPVQYQTALGVWPRAADGRHPGELFHQYLANQWYKEISSKQ